MTLMLSSAFVESYWDFIGACGLVSPGACIEPPTDWESRSLNARIALKNLVAAGRAELHIEPLEEAAQASIGRKNSEGARVSGTTLIAKSID
jgi:hypothetical protein